MSTISSVAAGAVTLLKAGSGSTTDTGAETLDSIALASGLTALDTLLVYWNIEAVTQNSGNVYLRNSTDTVTVSSAVNPTAGVTNILQSIVRQGKKANTAIDWLTIRKAGDDTLAGDGGRATFTTAWTGAWTLGLYKASLVSGGTLHWSWAVYKVLGQ